MYLIHHGILGQKWGVRHKQYPLGASEHTSAEKKAGYKKSIVSTKQNKLPGYVLKDGPYKSKNPQQDLLDTHKKIQRGIISGIKNKIAEGKQKKQERNEFIRKSVDYGNEYSEKTKQGKASKKAFEKEAKKYWNSDGDDDSAFLAAEKKHLTNEGKYVAKKLIKEYGEKKVSEMEKINYENVNDLIKKYSKHYYNVHSE